jgi:hypothetical protein
MNENTPDRLNEAVDELYGLPPDEFVPARDELVAAAREAGDRDAARAIAKLRRPTQAAWLANLLARERAQQLDALLSLAADLSDAQRSLDGAALRALSSQRNKLVAAMAREARALAGREGHRVPEATERDLRGILEAALADPDIADQVRSGRLHRTLSYSGFGPDAVAGAEPRPAQPRLRLAPVPPPEAAEPDESEAAEQAARDRAEAARRERERAAAERALADARAAAEEAADRQRRDRDDHDDAARRLTEAKDRVADLTAELEEARAAQRDAAEAERAAAAALRESAARQRAAAAEVERASALLADLTP